MIQDNTAKWRKKKLSNFAPNEALSVGFMYWTPDETVPVGRVKAGGVVYDRALYADLWSYAQEHGLVVTEAEWQELATANNGVCKYYSDGNGSTTFRTPNMGAEMVVDLPSEMPVAGNGMTVGLMGKNSSGQDVYAGLARENSNYPLTAYKQHYGDPYGVPNNEAAAEFITSLGITTDPTKSGIVAQTSAIKITGQWLIVAYGTVTNIGNVDIEHFINDLEQVKADVSTQATELGNVKAEVNSHFNSSGHLVLPDGSEFWIA